MITPQLDLFQDRLPEKPYCTDHLEQGLYVRPSHIAARKRYIQVNPPWLRSWLVFDIDRQGAVLAWEDAGLPEPYWCSVNQDNAHAHLSFGLDAPVLLGQHDRQHPMRYLAAVESAMREALGGDPGYSGLVTKNPLNKHWKTLWSRNSGIYDLNYLSEFLDLPKHAPKRRKPEKVGLGRNVDTFDFLRYRAYATVRGWKSEGGQGIYVRWQAHLYDLALQYTHNEHPTPLDHKECHHIAKSVARWTWTHFDAEASDERFRALQSHRGKKGGRPPMEDKQASARLMKAKGMSYNDVAKALGVSRRSVIGWCKKP